MHTVVYITIDGGSDQWLYVSYDCSKAFSVAGKLCSHSISFLVRGSSSHSLEIVEESELSYRVEW